MEVTDTLGVEWDPEWPRTAHMPCPAACSGHVLSNENTGWHGSVDSSLWKGKGVQKWISVYRSFHFSEGIILKIKVKSS